jgi:hypothetical protein
MQKIIKYNMYHKVNLGTEENPKWHESTNTVMMPWSESAEELAKKEAHNGEYTIEDDEHGLFD